MATLASMLYDMGNTVSGYDDAKDYKFTEKGLRERGIEIFYDSTHPLDKDTIVTASKAFSDDHREIKRIKELGLTFKPYNEVVGEITAKFDTISVCGTHGKTTTTSLLKHLFEGSIGCNYFIGDGQGHIDLKNKLLVIESDEFNRHFLAYHPKTAVITCVELEHTEIYKDIVDTIATFEKFANKAELVVANGDDENIRQIKFNNEVIFYGEKENNDYIIKNIKLDSEGSSFDLYEKDKLISNFFVPLYGHHMVMNTVASVIVALRNGLTSEKIKKLLENFKNAARRFAIEQVKDTIIVDDYAHHPTEIKVTLEAIKQKYPDKKLVVVFKPNTYSRTKDFTKEFISSLSIADKVFMTEIDSNRERQEDYPGVNSNIILDHIKDGEIIDEKSISKLLPYKNDVICFMSCASVSHLIEEFKKII